MKIRANKNLLHDELGSIQKGQELNVTENQLSGIRRFVEVLYEKARGKEVVCIASGPSLTKEDCAAVKVWRDQSQNRRVIVTNTTHELCPWADFLFAMDSAWWRLNIAAVLLTFRGERVTRHRRIEDVSYVEFSKTQALWGMGAIRLAAHYGATKNHIDRL